MNIELRGRFTLAEFADEFAWVASYLKKIRLTSVTDVQLQFRAFENDRECYGPDEHGKHMGFIAERAPSPSADPHGQYRHFTFIGPGMNPESVEVDGLEALWSLFPGTEQSR